jgi:uncharacterized protein DUF1524/uncharacterized protein DUF262
LGSVVAMPTVSVPEGVTKYLLIDGQQRLTTTFIFLALLRDVAKSLGRSGLAEEIEKTLLVNPFKSGPDYFKLLPTQADRASFYALFKSDSSPLQGSKIYKAYTFFERALKRSNRDIDQLKSIVSSRLSVVSIVLDASDNPFLVFEGLNAKGMPLTQADLVRNYFVMRVHVDKQEEVYGRFWKPMEDSLGQNLTEFIRHFLMRRGSDIKQNEVYVSLKDEVTPDNAVEYLDTLSRFGSFYERFLNPAKEPQVDIRKRLDRIKRLDITICHPLLLSLYDFYKSTLITLEELTKCLGLIENYMLRRFVAGVSTQGLQRVFAQLASVVTPAGTTEWLADQLARKACPGDAAIAAAFPTLRLYGAGERTEKAKLILEAFEECFGHKETPAFAGLSVEHVMPQTLTQEWMEDLGPQAKEIHDAWLHTIGNLTLTAYNAELSNARFPRKRDILNSSNLQLNKYFLDCNGWGDSEIQARASELTKKFLEQWPYFGKVQPQSDDQAAPIDLEEEDRQIDGPRQIRTPSQALEAKRAALVSAMSRRLGVPLQRSNNLTVYEDMTSGTRCCCVVSKRYKGQDMDYWYALHTHWYATLQDARDGYYVIGCMDLPFAFAIPIERLREWVPRLSKSEPEGREPYWHVKLKELAGKFSLKFPGAGNAVSVEEFRIPLQSS